MNPAVERSHNELVELRIPSRPEWVALARLAAATVANRLRFSIEEIEICQVDCDFWPTSIAKVSQFPSLWPLADIDADDKEEILCPSCASSSPI